MSILIHGALLMTMTEDEALQGDILIEDGRIKQIAASIDATDDVRLIDAAGCMVTPGLIDLHIRSWDEDAEAVRAIGLAAGVTTGLCWPQNEGVCECYGIEAGRPCVRINPDAWTEDALRRELQRYADEGQWLPVAQIQGRQQCHRVLNACRDTGCKMLLGDLSGCECMTEMIAASGCPVVIGVRHTGTGSMWHLAVRLHRMGVPVCLSTKYPTAALKHLRICASLCYRDGASRLEALRMITKEPAGILGLRDAGIIAEGVRADLCIYDGDPLLLATSHLMTIAAGRIIAK